MGGGGGGVWGGGGGGAGTWRARKPVATEVGSGMAMELGVASSRSALVTPEKSLTAV